MCKCGVESVINYNKFQQKRRCKQCGIKVNSDSRRLNFDIILKAAHDENWEVITKREDYINSDQLLDLLCPEKHECKIRWYNFKTGHRCAECYLEKNRGETHPSFNPNREEIPLNMRLRRTRTREWIVKNMKTDPNYNNFLLNVGGYTLDHIIPVKLFCKLHTNYNLNEEHTKNIINRRDNLQLLTKDENFKKAAKGSIYEAAQYLMLNGIKFI
jgi:hypothetical protein